MRERRHRRWSSTLVCCVLAAIVASGCSSHASDGQTDATTGTETKLATGDPMTLDVLVYNIEYGGDASTDRVIKSLDADVVGVLESYNRLPEIARRTGYPYYNVGLQLLSKYPILEPSGADGLYALIEVQPGYVAAFFNTHLDYVSYGPRLLESGMSVDDVMASERAVRSSLDIQQPHLASLADAGYPVILTGDFNEPSSLDYTDATTTSHPGVTGPIPWPVSESLFDIGYEDTFREVHPDPVADPGITYVNRHPDRDGPGDRIDYVYSGGPVKTTDSKVVGETGGRGVDIGFRPWTSDHRAVLSTVELTPVALPTTVSLDRRMLTQGDEVTVFYNAPGSSKLTLAVGPGQGARAAEDMVGDRPFRHEHVHDRRPGARRLRHRHARRRRPSDRAQRVLGAGEGCRGRDQHRPFHVRRRRAGDGQLGRRSCQPLGLDRCLPGRRVRPSKGRLPVVGLHRRPRLRGPPAVGQRFDDPRRLVARKTMATSTWQVRRALPAHRSVRVRRPRSVHRCQVTPPNPRPRAFGDRGLSDAVRREPALVGTCAPAD